jgi:hypothetical protein
MPGKSRQPDEALMDKTYVQAAPSTTQQTGSPRPRADVEQSEHNATDVVPSDSAKLVENVERVSVVDESVQGTKVDTRISEAADMISTLLQNRSLSPDPSTPLLMDLEVHKTPSEWQTEYLRLYDGGEDINFQSSGNVSKWFGDFMKPGATLYSLCFITEVVHYGALTMCDVEGAMDSLLKARAFKKEVILTVSDGQHLQSSARLQRSKNGAHGYSNGQELIV